MGQIDDEDFWGNQIKAVGWFQAEYWVLKQISPALPETGYFLGLAGTCRASLQLLFPEKHPQLARLTQPSPQTSSVVISSSIILTRSLAFWLRTGISIISLNLIRFSSFLVLALPMTILVRYYLSPDGSSNTFTITQFSILLPISELAKSWAS